MPAKKFSFLVAFAFAIGFSFLLYAFHQSSPNSHAQSSGYSVVGNKIIDPNGKQWTPYGFILECLGYQSTTATTCQPTKGAPGVDFSDLAKISATANFWKGNAVRLQVAQENLFSQSPYNASFVSKMDNEVSTANSLGLVVVLTLQEEEWSGPVFPTQSAITFWQWMADHYKNNPNVMFDLYNEPQLSSSTAGGENNLWNIWQSGGTAPGNGVAYVGFQALVDAVRGQGANNIVIAESNNYDKDLTQVLTHQLTGGNVAYGVEVNLYSDSRNSSQWATNFGNYTQSVPIMPEAFRDNAGNTCDPNSPADVPALLSYLNGIHMGAFVWTLAPGIVTNNAGLGNPTTYPAPGATISCPPSLSGISDTNTVGPGAELLNFFTNGTSSGGQPPTPSISFLKPSNGATVSGTVSVSAKAAVSSGSITNVTITADGNKIVSCVNPTCSSSWITTSLSNGAHTLAATTSASGGGSSSTSETVTVSNTPTCTITIPSNVTSPSQTTTSIDLRWAASSDSCYPASQLTYRISRNGALVGSSSTGSPSYTDSGLAPGTTYSYTITAVDPGGNLSSPSNAFTQSTNKPNCPKPAAPMGLASSNVASTNVTLTWQAVPNPTGTCVVTSYVVSRDTVPLAQPTSTSYSDGTVSASTIYTYTVLAVETGNIAGDSSSITVTTPKPTQTDPGPTAPSNLTATPASQTQVNLSWSASSDTVAGIKQYNVLRNGTQIGTISPSTNLSFGDSGLSASTTYSYQVVAVSGTGLTTSSATVKATTLNRGGPTVSGGTHNPGGSGGDSQSSNPLLSGTTSVGSGSDTGQRTTQNPTATPQPSTVKPLSGNSQKSQTLTARTVVYVGGSLLIVLGLGLGVWFFGLRPRYADVLPGMRPDPDLVKGIVVDGVPQPRRASGHVKRKTKEK